MTISVIMPVYNCRDYLPAAIGSVLSAGVDDIEIIAVDDCSTDDSRAILARLAEDDPRIKPVYNEKNMGVAAVRNLALQHASGEFLAFCDSDDIVPEGAYRYMIDAAEGYDVVIGGFADMSDSGMVRTTYLHSSERTSLFKALMAVGCLWTKLIRRSAVMNAELRFDEDMRIGEDVVFLSRLSTLPLKYTVIDKMIYNHLHHDAAVTPSLTHVYNYTAFKSHLECRKRMLAICEAGGVTECRSYVYENFSTYLDRFITFISDYAERRRAFYEFRDYLKGYDWENRGDLFRALFGIRYEDMMTTTPDGYIQLKYDVLPRDAVAAEFRAGKIGFKWILTYFRGWLSYKFKKK